MNRKSTKPKLLMPPKECYTEQEAAGYLNISVAHLLSLLDEHIFNDGTDRPQDLTFRESDLVLLGYWNEGKKSPKIIRMPRRKS